MNLGDPELEVIDPTPNVYNLFIHFDKIFFWTKLASRAVVRWSKRMYSCAGVCSYEGRGGLCDIALSEPLLKLRPRKDLVETLLHEMIHAYLFITCQDRERDGHGPNFQAHMHRINKSAGLNISIYHDFHDEVKLYQTHWWRCNGVCQKVRPFFGIVRRSQNRAPGPNDFWWSAHKRNCGGTFIKIKEPEKQVKKNTTKKSGKNIGDITKYVNNNNNNQILNNNPLQDIRKPLTSIEKNVIVTPATNWTPGAEKSRNKSPLFAPGKTISPNISNDVSKSVNNSDVLQTVRNIWANKQLPTKSNLIVSKQRSIDSQPTSSNKVIKPNKHKADSIHSDSPPAKVKKIDEYFTKTAASLLKDVYGQEIVLSSNTTNNKMVAVSSKNLVNCPICSNKVNDTEINRHLDECLNKEVIEQLKDKDPISDKSENGQSSKPNKLKKIVGIVPTIPAFNGNNLINNNNRIKKESDVKAEFVDLTNINKPIEVKKEKEAVLEFDSNDVNRVKAVVKRIDYDKHIRKSDNFIIPKEEANEIDCGFLPSFLDDMSTAIKAPRVKIEPGTSKDIASILSGQKCPCCGISIDKTVAEHLDECLAFFDNNTTIPEEGASTSFANDTIVIDDDDDDIFDETITMNATGTKTPCPCCLDMVELAEMNDHLDRCLN